MLAELGKGNGSHLVFLDACRNNPFARAGVTLPAAGLARVGKLPGFFITFATQPDNVAFDGSGRNSPFATALLGHIATPGADISSMMIAVRNDVFAATGGQQIPADESLLTKQVYFAGSAASEETLETQLWRLAGKDRDPNLLQAYLDRYPDGPHAADVRSLLRGAGKAAATTGQSQADIESVLWAVARSERRRQPRRALSRTLPERRACRRREGADREPAGRGAGVRRRPKSPASASPPTRMTPPPA